MVDGDAKQSLKKLGEAADELKVAAADTRALVNKLQGPTADFASSGLPQLSTAIASLETATQSLDRIVGGIEQNPRGFVAKPPARELEVRP